MRENKVVPVENKQKALIILFFKKGGGYFLEGLKVVPLLMGLIHHSPA